MAASDTDLSAGSLPAAATTVLDRRVLLLTPSSGLGGGIERYVETLEWVFSMQGVRHQRIDLFRSGAAAHARMIGEARKILRENPMPTRLVVAHRALLPVAWLLARERSVCGISVVCHGSDVWDVQVRPRRCVEGQIMRRPGVRVVAASSFTAGAVSRVCRATILPPGLSQEWFDTLVEHSAREKKPRSGVHLVTAFRLADWRDKGLPQLMAAVAALRRPDVHLTVCGSGMPPADLRAAVRAHPHCVLRPGLTDQELAAEFAGADIFVLATRTRSGRHACGEGFGLVLLEAQVAGTLVVAPAYGGSPDAYLDGLTGVAPRDESVAALSRVLEDLVQDPQRLEQMGRHAAEWARVAFAPERYARLALSRLL